MSVFSCSENPDCPEIPFLISGLHFSRSSFGRLLRWRSPSVGARLSAWEVFPDWKKKKYRAQGQVSHGDAARFRRRLQQFFQRKSDRKERKPPAEHRLLANEVHVKGLDAALDGGLGLSLQTFLPHRACAPLTESEERFVVPVSSLPPEVQELAPEREDRLCIRDTTTGATKFEVVWSNRRTLVNVLDQGAEGWPSKFWLAYRLKLRFEFFFDPPHRRHNNCLMAMQQAGLSQVRAQISIAQNMMMGPWGTNKNFTYIRGAFDEYMKQADYMCPLFQLLYERISLDLSDGVVAATFGTQEHQKEIWVAMQEAPVLKRKGSSSKANRWFNWETKSDDIHKYGGVLLLALLVVACTTTSSPASMRRPSSQALA